MTSVRADAIARPTLKPVNSDRELQFLILVARSIALRGSLVSGSKREGQGWTGLWAQAVKLAPASKNGCGA